MGCTDGRNEGLSVGIDVVGEWDGDAVLGLIVGNDSVGEKDGDKVGDKEGTLVGSFVGLDVDGANVGVIVGDIVGAIEGDKVWWEQSPGVLSNKDCNSNAEVVESERHLAKSECHPQEKLTPSTVTSPTQSAEHPPLDKHGSMVGDIVGLKDGAVDGLENVGESVG